MSRRQIPEIRFQQAPTASSSFSDLGATKRRLLPHVVSVGCGFPLLAQHGGMKLRFKINRKVITLE